MDEKEILRQMMSKENIERKADELMKNKSIRASLESLAKK
jgi:hypothetical protein